LQGVRILSAILKIVFRHIFYYFLFVFNAVQALTSGGFRIVSDTLVTRVITINHEMKVNAGGVIVSEFDT